MNVKTACGAVVLLAVTALTTMTAEAQSKTITGEVQTLTVSVEAIDQQKREVTVKKADGNYDVLYIPTTIKRFDTLKVGDKVTARYYETLVLQVKAPGEKDVDTIAGGVTRNEERSAGTVARQQKITATITAIDPKVPSITFTGPRNWTYSSRVKDTEALAKVKVGDKVDMTWTEALVLGLEDSK